MPGTGPSLRTGFAWTFAGNAVNGFSQWAVLSLIAKLSTPEVLGQYALGVAVSTPVAMLAHLNLRSVLATDVQGRHPFRDYYAVRLAATVGGIAVTMLIALFWKPLWPAGATILLAGIGLAAENFEDLYYGVMQRKERLDRVAQSMILRAAFTVCCVAGALVIYTNAPAAAAGFLVARAGTLLLFDVRTADAPIDQAQAPAEVFRAAAPLGLALMLSSLTSTIPRYVVEHVLGTAPLGIFVAVASFVTVGSTMMNALGQSATTRLARAYAAGEVREFELLSLRLAGIGFAIGTAGVAVAVVAGAFFLRILYRPEFAVYQRLLVYMLTAGTLSYVASVLGFVTTSTRRFHQQLPLLIAVAGASAATSLLAVPRMGLSGAVLALGVAALVQIGGHLLILRKAL